MEQNTLDTIFLLCFRGNNGQYISKTLKDEWIGCGKKERKREREMDEIKSLCTQKKTHTHTQTHNQSINLMPAG